MVGDDNFVIGDGDDFIVGGDGKDNICGGWGNDCLYGGVGDDMIMGCDVCFNLMVGLIIVLLDDDMFFGGVGNDLFMGNGGNDQLWGGIGNDVLLGGDGEDLFYGEDGDDKFFGGNGSDVFYGGDGNDYLVGSEICVNWLELLIFVVVGNDKLYGGVGDDIFIIVVGDDYFDGGVGNDCMEGGMGNDIYVVSSFGDVVVECVNGGNDMVLVGCSYMLLVFVEELYFMEGGNFNVGGNGLDNCIIGNNQDNIIDGGVGVDIMIGGKGNDIYFIDNVGDKVVEQVGEGNDIVYLCISMIFVVNVENLVLMDVFMFECVNMDGQLVLIYGVLYCYNFDYDQGGDFVGFDGICGEISIVNVLNMVGQLVSEVDVVKCVIECGLCNFKKVNGMGGGINVYECSELLDSYGVVNCVIVIYDEQILVDVFKEGCGVFFGVCSLWLWGYGDNGKLVCSDYVIMLMGVVCDEVIGVVKGVFIVDFG